MRLLTPGSATENSIMYLFVFFFTGKVEPSRGYSTFKFIPNSSDGVIVALKTQEIADKYQSFITAFTTVGEILLPDTLVSSQRKFEGLVFL